MLKSWATLHFLFAFFRRYERTLIDFAGRRCQFMLTYSTKPRMQKPKAYKVYQCLMVNWWQLELQAIVSPMFDTTKQETRCFVKIQSLM